MKQYNLRTASSPDDIESIRSVRHRVFVVEQGVDEALEWAGEEKNYIYVLARDEDQVPIGTGRILIESDVATIGRMAILKDWRHHGVGSAILNRLMKIGQSSGATAFVLSAQLTAIEFYQSHGFVAQGDVYLDAGIEHRKMTMSLHQS